MHYSSGESEALVWACVTSSLSRAPRWASLVHDELLKSSNKAVFSFLSAADRLRDTCVDRCYRSWCTLCSVWLNNQMMCALDPIQRENDLRKIGSRQLTFLTCVVYEREHGETCTAAQVCCLDGHSIVMCDHSMQWGAVCGLCVVLVICTSQKALIAVWSLTCVIIQNVKVSTAL